MLRSAAYCCCILATVLTLAKAARMLAIEPPVAAKVLHSALFGWRDTATLTEEDLEEIWRFSSRFFDRSREDYLRMIRAADEVCVLRRESEIAGFAAVRYFDVREDGRTHRLIHGITIQLAPELRGHHFFLLASLSRILRSRLRAPTASFYAFWSAGTPATYIQVYRACAEISATPECRDSDVHRIASRGCGPVPGLRRLGSR